MAVRVVITVAVRHRVVMKLAYQHQVINQKVLRMLILAGMAQQPVM